jgi:hypothetical protein
MFKKFLRPKKRYSREKTFVVTSIKKVYNEKNSEIKSKNPSRSIASNISQIKNK